MTPFSKKFEKEYARVLLKIAQGDLESGKVLSENAGGRPENTCYLVQQAVEKALKAVICFAELPVPLTHDIAALIAAIPDHIPPPPQPAKLVSLSEFATIRRYEEGYYKLDSKEIKATVQLGGSLLGWAKTVIG